MPDKFLIYALSDPRTSELRYIGKSSSGLHRPRVHLKIVDRPRTHKERWVNSVIRSGVTPEIDVIEVLSSQQDLDEAERFWIAYWRYIGADLTNATDGGDGWAIGDRNPMRNPEANARHRASMRGKSFTPDHKRNHAAAMASDEVRERYRQESTAKWQDAEYREKVTAAVRSALSTPAHRMMRKQGALDRAAMDFVGRRFGRLIVLGYVMREGRRESEWRCQCDCGNETTTRRSNLVRGDTKSCGCLYRERGKASAK